MSGNLFARFVRLLPSAPLLVGEVISSGDGSSVVELPGGARITVRGEGTPGGKVFVRGGVIDSTAPDLPTVTIEV